MSSALRKIQRAINRRAVKQLFTQVFINRQVWDDFEAEIKSLPEDDRPRDATIAVHSLIASWVQGRRDARRLNKGGLVQIAGQLPGDAPEGELARKLREEYEKEPKAS